MVLRGIVALALMLTPAFGLAETQPQPGWLADGHRAHGLTCAACHHETPPHAAVPDQICIACHGGVAAIIARTADYASNPHVSPHTAELRCGSCHHAHKASEVSCLACHPDKTFVKHGATP